MASQFANMTSSLSFFWHRFISFVKFSYCSSFMSTSPLVLEVWQFSFQRDWPEIRKLEISPSKFCPIYGDWSVSEIPNFARIFLMKYYWMLQNARITAFTVYGKTGIIVCCTMRTFSLLEYFLTLNKLYKTIFRICEFSFNFYFL